MNKTNKSNQQFWDEFSADYEALVGENGDIHHETIVNPIVFNLLGGLEGKTVLDAGCGNGYLSRRMAKTAKRVVGIDFTDSFIQTAKERSQSIPNIEFILGNLEEIPFSAEEFDTILCNLVLINVEHLEKVVHELTRVLKRNGILVISLTHPCFENLPHTTTLYEESGKPIGRLVKSYFTTGLIINTEDRNQFHYHYTISDYLNAFSQNNLFLEETIEPNSADIKKNHESDITPTFLIMKLKKFAS